MNGPWTIVGQGLAGTCLAWRLWKAGVPFTIIDRERGGASRVAAGLINPITGKNFEPSWRIADFLPQALEFYAEIEAILGVKLWHPMAVLRLAGSEKEWAKISGKLEEESVKPWVGGIREVAGWTGAVEVTGGGRVDTKLFVDASREFFRERGIYQKGDDGDGPRIWCDGAVGLMAGKYGPHRCAKGEILTVKAEGWDESRIRVGGGGWLVPIGDGMFRAGATYEWNELDELPTEKGREFVESIITKLCDDRFTVISHDAGIRPIIRKSQPVIGSFGPDRDWMFNGLGSKGSLYAPGVSARLLNMISMDGFIDLDFVIPRK